MTHWLHFYVIFIRSCFYFHFGLWLYLQVRTKSSQWLGGFSVFGLWTLRSACLDFPLHDLWHFPPFFSAVPWGHRNEKIHQATQVRIPWPLTCVLSVSVSHRSNHCFKSSRLYQVFVLWCFIQLYIKDEYVRGKKSVSCWDRKIINDRVARWSEITFPTLKLVIFLIILKCLFSLYQTMIPIFMIFLIQLGV